MCRGERGKSREGSMGFCGRSWECECGHVYQEPRKGSALHWGEGETLRNNVILSSAVQIALCDCNAACQVSSFPVTACLSVSRFYSVLPKDQNSSSPSATRVLRPKSARARSIEAGGLPGSCPTLGNIFTSSLDPSEVCEFPLKQNVGVSWCRGQTE